LFIVNICVDFLWTISYNNIWKVIPSAYTFYKEEGSKVEDKNHKVLKSFVMITQISINMMVPIFICAALGVWLGRLFSTDVCFLILVFIGIGASFRNVYILTKSFYSEDMKKEHDRLKYIQELKDYSNSHPAGEEEYKEIVKTKRYPENKGPARK